MSDERPSEIIASMEGKKVVGSAHSCALFEYNFEENVWHEQDRIARPVSQEKVECWLQGWNEVDRDAALKLVFENR